MALKKLPWACRHAGDFDHEALRSKALDYLCGEDDEYAPMYSDHRDDITDMDILHVLTAEFGAVEIHGDQWFRIKTSHYLVPNVHYMIDCDNIIDGLLAIYLEARQEHERRQDEEADTTEGS